MRPVLGEEQEPVAVTAAAAAAETMTVAAAAAALVKPAAQRTAVWPALSQNLCGQGKQRK